MARTTSTACNDLGEELPEKAAISEAPEFPGESGARLRAREVGTLRQPEMAKVSGLYAELNWMTSCDWAVGKFIGGWARSTNGFGLPFAQVYV